MVRSRQYHNRAQLVLELEPQVPRAPVARNAKGLLEALADLLLEALEAEGATTAGGVDEFQDHA
jgi:hypothetical protein